MYRRCGFRYEKKLRATGVGRIAGIDEVGRGALAGPVVAAAVVLPEKFRHRRLNDSKQLAPELREEIYSVLVSDPEVRWTVGTIDSTEIDRINILRASHRAMRLAISRPAYILKPGDIDFRGNCFGLCFFLRATKAFYNGMSRLMNRVALWLPLPGVVFAQERSEFNGSVC